MEFSDVNLRRLLDSMFIFVGVLTPDGILIEANKTALNAASLSPEDVIGKYFEDTYWWAYSEESKKTLRNAIQAAQKGKIIRYDYEVRVADDKFITIDFCIAPVYDEYGTVVSLIPSGNDITARKVTEEALREIQQNLTIATESAGVGVWGLDVSTGMLTWSALHKTMWGYQSDLDSLFYEDWHKVIHPSDLAHTFGQVEKAKRTKEKYLAEYRIIRANDGEIRWMRSVGQFFYHENGEAKKLTGITYDITREKVAEQALRESESRLSGVVNAIPDGFMIFESVRDEATDEIVDFRWLFVNPAAEAIVGKKATELIGKKLLKEMPGNKETGLFDSYKNVVETGDVWMNEFAYSYEGLDHYFLTRAVKINDGSLYQGYLMQLYLL